MQAKVSDQRRLRERCSGNVRSLIPATTPGDLECVVCGSGHWVHHGERAGYALRRCGLCGFVRAALPPSFDAEFLYGEDYNYGRGCDDSALIPEARDPEPAFVARRQYWLALLAAEVGGPGRLLDIGCGAGALLDVAQEQGWDGVGQEISHVAAAEARAHGHPVVVGELSEDRFADWFDAATMIEVIEHIPDPRPTLTAARGLIREGGALLVTTGDLGSARARLQGVRWHYIRPPLHVSYYTRETMKRLLLTCGFSRVAFAPTFNLAFPSLPIVGAPTRPLLRRTARLVRRLSRSEMCVLAIT